MAARRGAIQPAGKKSVDFPGGATPPRTPRLGLLGQAAWGGSPVGGLLGPFRCFFMIFQIKKTYFFKFLKKNM